LANRLWWKTADFLYDRQEHLCFRGESYLQRTEKNGQKMFWSRGNGRGWAACRAGAVPSQKV